MSASLTPERLYLQLGSLVAEMPDLASGPITAETNQWLGRAAALVDATGDTFGKILLTNAAQWLAGVNRDLNAQTIATVVYQALAKAKLAAPAAVQGGFIAAGTLRRLRTRQRRARRGHNRPAHDRPVCRCEDFAIRVVSARASERPHPGRSGSRRYQPSLRPAVEQWVQQYRSTRPLSVRLAAPNTFHDRSISVDRATAYSVGQSFKGLAARSYTTLVLQNPETAAQMIAAFETMWDAATPL